LDINFQINLEVLPRKEGPSIDLRFSKLQYLQGSTNKPVTANTTLLKHIECSMVLKQDSDKKFIFEASSVHLYD
jgi:hypothetical protein